MSTPTSSITKVVVGAPTAESGGSITCFVGTSLISPKKLAAVYLYGPNRTNPKAALLSAWALPLGLPAGTYTLVVRVQGETADYRPTLTVAAASAGNTPADAGLRPWTRFAACTDYGTLATLAPKAWAIGVTDLRSFCPGLATGGKYGTGHIQCVRDMRKASPKTRFLGLHGMKQGCGYVASADDALRYFEAHFAAIEEFGDGYETELNNEIQLFDYWSKADPKDGSKLNIDGVKAAAQMARIARQAAGKGPKIIGFSVGWGASSAIHAAVWKILVEEGVLDSVDAVNDHAYPYGGAAQLEEQLGGIAALAPGKPIYVTEIGVNLRWKDDTRKKAELVPLADVPQAAFELGVVLQKHNALPAWYRLMPGSAPHWSDDRGIFLANASINAPLTSRLGLTKAAA